MSRSVAATQPAVADAALPEVVSPCNRICTLDAAQVCIGCGRSLQEIVDWSQASASSQRRIVEAARSRLAAMARPAGSAAR